MHNDFKGDEDIVCAQLFMLHHIGSKELLLRYYSRNFTNRITNEGKKNHHKVYQ